MNSRLGYKNISINKDFINFLIIVSMILIIYIPISGIPVIFDTLSGDEFRIVRRLGRNRNLILTIFRDVLLLFFYITVLFFLFRNKINKIKIDYFLMATFIFLLYMTFSFFNSIFKNNILVALSGLRIYQVFISAFCFYQIVENYSNYKVYFFRYFNIIFVLEFLICLFQTQFMLPYEGITIFGSRVTGSFNNPNTIGIFFAFSLLLFIFFQNLFLKKINRYLFSIMALLGVLASGSRTAIIICFFLLSFQSFFLLKNFIYKVIFCLVGIFSFIALYYSMAYLAGRGGTTVSLLNDPRWKTLGSIFSDSSINEILFGVCFGFGNNTLISLINSFPNLFKVNPNLITVTDSTISTLIKQLGILGLSLYFVLLILGSFYLKRLGIVIFGFIFLLGISNAWYEMYPINLLISIVLGITLSEKRTIDLKHS